MKNETLVGYALGLWNMIFLGKGRLREDEWGL
jgi:hypothetical protein